MEQGGARTTRLSTCTIPTEPMFRTTTMAVWGTYLHGIFDNGPWRRSWLNRLRQQRGLRALPTGIANYREQREQMLDQLAESIEPHLNLKP